MGEHMEVYSWELLGKSIYISILLGLIYIFILLREQMSYGQYSWLITIKNGASDPMVHRDFHYNHYFRILIMDGMTINHIVSIDHGSNGGLYLGIVGKIHLYILLGKNVSLLCHVLTLDLLKVVNSEQKVNYGQWGI